MRALRLHGDRDLRVDEVPPPPPPAEGEVQVRIGAVALNHIDVWGWRGMAFARRRLSLVVGAEAAGTVAAAGPGTAAPPIGAVVAIYGANTCGTCPACREGRDNLCENVQGVRGFHVDGMAQELVNLPARQIVAAPAGVKVEDAATAPITYGTVQHMLFDNAKLQAGQTVLVQAGASGIGTAAVQLAKAAGATVIATVGSDDKVEAVRRLGADHVINYTTERFEGVVRKLTKKRGVDVVFEHVGTATFTQSLFSLRPGGTLVTCGSTTGTMAEVNLHQLFQRQQRIIGSFGCTIRNLAESMEKMASGAAIPVIDSVIGLDGIDAALARMEKRRVIGKILVRI